MKNYTNEQKAQIYNNMLFHYQRLQEQVRLIRAENLEIGEKEQQKIDLIEKEMKIIYDATQKLY